MWRVIDLVSLSAIITPSRMKEAFVTIPEGIVMRRLAEGRFGRIGGALGRNARCGAHRSNFQNAVTRQLVFANEPTRSSQDRFPEVRCTRAGVRCTTARLL